MASESVRERAGSRGKVLVVGDTPVLLRALERELSQEFMVLAVETGPAAMTALLEHDALCAVVTDFDLGSGPNGGDVLETARDLRATSVRVLVTASGCARIAKLLDAGTAHTCILKPYRHGEVLDALRRLLAASGAHAPQV